MARESVKVIHGALDEFGNDKSIVLRGVLDPGSLGRLKVAAYQREIMPYARIAELMQAFRTGRVPDIELGVRGGDFHERESAFYLADDAYIIDGQQRVNAALQLLREDPKAQPRLGALVHFNTTEAWERERFRILNTERTRVSPNVLLRNMQPDHPVVDALRRLAQDKGFILYNRVSWDQRVARHELITALTFFRVVGALHAHLGPGLTNKLEELVRGTQTIMDKVGINTFRDNVRTFFETVDACWGVRAIAFREGAAYMRTTFLVSLAKVFSNHQVFWKKTGDTDTRLFVEKDLQRKLASFPVGDPSVRSLAGSGGQAGVMLVQMMVEHLNTGKRNRRLVPRQAVEPVTNPEEGDANVAADADSDGNGNK